MLQILKCKSMISSPNLLGSKISFFETPQNMNLYIYSYVSLNLWDSLLSLRNSSLELQQNSSPLYWYIVIPEEDWIALTRTAKYVLDYLKYHAYFYYASIIFSNANLTARVFFLSGRPLHFSCFKRKFFLFELAWENFVRHF